MGASETERGERPTAIPDADAVLCALVLAPGTLSRNRFFKMFEDPGLRKIRRRAKRARGIIRQVLGHGRDPAVIVGRQVMDDRVLLKLEVERLSYHRTTSLTLLEASLVQYALHKAQGLPLEAEDRGRVEEALSKLNADNSSASGPQKGDPPPAPDPL